MIKPTDLFPKQAKDFHLHLVEPFNQIMDRALDGHADTMNPFEELEHPTQGWPRGRLVDLTDLPPTIFGDALKKSEVIAIFHL